MSVCSVENADELTIIFNILGSKLFCNKCIEQFLYTFLEYWIPYLTHDYFPTVVMGRFSLKSPPVSKSLLRVLIAIKSYVVLMALILHKVIQFSQSFHALENQSKYYNKNRVPITFMSYSFISSQEKFRYFVRFSCFS